MRQASTNMPRKYTRRNILGIGSVLIASGGTWAIFGNNNASKTTRTILETTPQPPISITTASGMRIHGLQTGWIAIKQNHYQLTGPEALRIASILGDTRWTQPLPMLSWVIEHPEGINCARGKPRSIHAPASPNKLSCTTAI
jgi:hypothetical protein